MQQYRPYRPPQYIQHSLCGTEQGLSTLVGWLRAETLRRSLHRVCCRLLAGDATSKYWASGRFRRSQIQEESGARFRRKYPGSRSLQNVQPCRQTSSSVIRPDPAQNCTSLGGRISFVPLYSDPAIYRNRAGAAESFPGLDIFSQLV